MALNGLSVGSIFAIALGVYFLSALVPPALDNFFSVNTDGWDTGTASLWVIIPLAIVALIVLHFIPSSSE